MGPQVQKDTRTDKEKQRDSERVMTRSVNKIEYEIKKLDKNETKALKEVEKLARKGQHGPAKTMAKTVGMIRAQRTNMYNTQANLTSMSMQMKTMGMNATVMEAMGNCTKVMAEANAQTNVKSVTSMIRDFQKEAMKTDMKNDIVLEAMDIPFAVDQEADDVYNSILGEIGIDIDVEVQPGTCPIQPNKTVSVEKIQPKNVTIQEDERDNTLEDLEARMAALEGM